MNERDHAKAYNALARRSVSEFADGSEWTFNLRDGRRVYFNYLSEDNVDIEVTDANGKYLDLYDLDDEKLVAAIEAMADSINDTLRDIWPGERKEEDEED